VSATHPKQFVLYKDSSGQWRWRLFAANSKIIADSAEGYVSKADAIHGAKLVASLAAGAAIWNYDTQQWESA
jgi:uncharacterized protein YegP (UPF0339 family)